MIEGDVLGNGLLGINQLFRMAPVPVHEITGVFGKSKINTADLV